jgi:predicted small secreted protein
MSKPIMLAITLIAVASSVTGCRNTAEGIGQDVERAGEKIQEKVD